MAKTTPDRRAYLMLIQSDKTAIMPRIRLVGGKNALVNRAGRINSDVYVRGLQG